ncbi:MAG: ABC transporter substrate-binding protein [Pseudomonadota bacterium]
MHSLLSRRTFVAALAGAAALPLHARAKGEPIRIGRSLPLSGIYGDYGRMRVAGSDLFIAQLNAGGGVDGRPVEVPTLDDVYDAARLKNNIAALDERERVLAMFGTLGPALAPNMHEFAERRLALIAATTGFSLRKVPQRYIFPMRPGFAEETAAIVQHVLTRGFTRVAVLHGDDAFGTLGRDGYAEALARAGIRPLATLVARIDGGNAAQVAAELKAADCQCVLLTMGAPTLGAVVRAYAPLGKLPAAFSVSAVNANLVIAELGERAEGIGISQVVPSPSNTKFPVVRDYLQALQAAGKGEPSIYGLEGYLEARLLVTGLQRASRGGVLTRESIARTFDTLGDVDLGGYHVSYAPGVRTGATYVDMTFIGAGGKVRS